MEKLGKLFLIPNTLGGESISDIIPDDVIKSSILLRHFAVEEIKSATPLPFERGRSWVKGVEDGISGFGYYVYGMLFPSSRSGRGIQSKNKIRVAAYRPVKYMTELYTKFIKNLK